MARKKDAAALFEVIAQTQERRTETNVRLPSWAGSQETADQAGDPQQPPPPSPGSASARPAPQQAPAQTLELSLSYTAAAVAAGGLVVLLIAVFLLGRVTAPPAATPAGAPAGPPSKAKTSGMYYLVVETVRGDDQQAQAVRNEIRQFLLQQEPKIYVDAYKPANNDSVRYMLARQGFASPDSAEARAFAERVHALGRKFAQTAVGRRSGYDFNMYRNGRLNLDRVYLKWP